MFSFDKFGSHQCDKSLKGVKTIPVVYFRDDSYNDKKIMSGWGVDGVLYTFEVVPRKPIPIIQPIRRKFTEGQSDEDLTKPITIRLIFNVLFLQDNRLTKTCPCTGNISPLFAWVGFGNWNRVKGRTCTSAKSAANNLEYPGTSFV
jgi:hypothetical protein